MYGILQKGNTLMNIFYVDKDPKIAAKMMCDKHIIKMILESAQMLCTAKRVKTVQNILILQRMVQD